MPLASLWSAASRSPGLLVNSTIDSSVRIGEGSLVIGCSLAAGSVVGTNSVLYLVQSDKQIRVPDGTVLSVSKVCACAR